MQQFILTVEDTKVVPALKKVIGLMNGVSLSKPQRKRKTSYERACEDIDAGRVTTWKSTEEMFSALNIKI